LKKGAYQNGFYVPPKSVEAIRSAAERLRPILVPDGAPDLENFVQSLEEQFGISYDVVEDHLLPPGVEALCLPERPEIVFSATAYDGVIRNDGRARFTVFHELGHLLLLHSRTFHRGLTGQPELFENSEWQADQFAAEMLMPLSVIRSRNLSEAGELQREFKVSYSAASKRLKQLKRRGEI